MDVGRNVATPVLLVSLAAAIVAPCAAARPGNAAPLGIKILGTGTADIAGTFDLLGFERGRFRLGKGHLPVPIRKDGAQETGTGQTLGVEVSFQYQGVVTSG